MPYPSQKGCCCFHTGFLSTQPGVCKIAVLVLSAICESLLLNYGSYVSGILGKAYSSFLTTLSACMMTTLLLLVAYIVSESSFHLIRKSVFEFMFNVVACLMFCSAASLLLVLSVLFLWPLNIMAPIFNVYPAMMITAVCGFLIAFLYGIDGYYAFKAFR